MTQKSVFGARLKISCLQSCGSNKIAYSVTHTQLLHSGRTGSIGFMVNVNNLKKQEAAFFRSLIKLHANNQGYIPYRNRENILLIENLL